MVFFISLKEKISIHNIYTYILFSATRQTALFSATVDDKIKNLAKLALNSNPILISVEDRVNSTVDGLQQGYVVLICTIYSIIYLKTTLLCIHNQCLICYIFTLCQFYYVDS